MCGRYICADGRDVSELCFITEKSCLDESYPCECVPGCFAPIITQNGRLVRAKWGLPGKNHIVFNLRSEGLLYRSLTEMKSFSRCIVPARAYFEWMNFEEVPADHGVAPDTLTRRKLRFLFTPREKILLMCGLLYNDGSGNAFTIITRPAEPEFAFIHSRMPLLIREETAKTWLSDSSASEIFSENREAIPLSVRSAY